MAINDFIISTLNISDDMIFSIDIYLIYIKQMILILSVPVRDLCNMLLTISSNLKLVYE